MNRSDRLLYITLLVGLGALALFYTASVSLYLTIPHNDLGWHIAAGDWIREHLRIPRTDPWSFASESAPWVNLAWLWDVWASVLFEYAGFEAHVITTALLGGLCFCLMVDLALRYGAHAAVAVGAAVWVLISIPYYAVPDVFFSSSPQLMTYVFILVMLRILHKPDFKEWQPALVVLLWVNMHNGFVLGFIALACVGLVALIHRRRTQIVKLIRCGLWMFLASLINPYGVWAYWVVFRNNGHIHQQYVSEWQPLISLLNSPFSLTFLPVFVVLIAYGVVVRKWWCQRGMLPSWHMLFSTLLLCFGCLQLRFISMWMIVSMPLIACVLRHQGASVISRGGLPTSRILQALAVYMFVLLTVMPPAIQAHQSQNLTPPGNRYPKQAVELILERKSQPRLINHWNFGSWLILYNRNQLQPLIDGRAATAYPDTFFDVFMPVITDHSVKHWQVLLASYSPDAILWLVHDTQNVEALKALPDWEEVYRDDDAIVFLPRKAP